MPIPSRPVRTRSPARAPALGDEYDLVEVEDTDGDGVDDYDESLLGSDGKPIGDKDDPKITPTSAQIKAGTPP